MRDSLSMGGQAASVDVLVADLLARSPYRFAVVTTPEDRATAFRLRHEANPDDPADVAETPGSDAQSGDGGPAG